MKRTRIALRVATMLTAGAMILQLGPCITMGLGAGTAGLDVNSLFLDENGTFLGIFHLCGEPNIRVVDQNGIIQGEYNTEDDVVYGCPFTEVVSGN